MLFLMIYACCPAPKTGDHSCAIIIMSENVIGFANGNMLHRQDMAEKVVKHGERYCVASRPNKVSCKNTSYTPGILMCRFPKDARLQRLWTWFIRRHRANFEPLEYSQCHQMTVRCNMLWLQWACKLFKGHSQSCIPLPFLIATLFLNFFLSLCWIYGRMWVLADTSTPEPNKA